MRLFEKTKGASLCVLRFAFFLLGHRSAQGGFVTKLSNTWPEFRLRRCMTRSAEMWLAAQSLRYEPLKGVTWSYQLKFGKLKLPTCRQDKSDGLHGFSPSRRVILMANLFHFYLERHLSGWLFVVVLLTENSHWKAWKRAAAFVLLSVPRQKWL